ncbi:hypothetical protein KSP40_PGU014270 [Platanthera guangdongensis]|uniref:Uncharacterized protein n=1 Tax=Platanthera guangdongensis TaxID=2320717 RepID=A0ABR2MID7_9ASPA
MSARRAKWHSPHPPAQRILHLPRRSSLFWTAKPRYKSTADKRKAEVDSSSSTCKINVDSSEDRCRFQLDILRAECSFLRMEREVALCKLERNRAQMDSDFRSALETMVSGRRKLGPGGSASMALDEEIVELQANLEKMQRDFRWRRGIVDRSGVNFDPMASVLRRRVKGIRECCKCKELVEKIAAQVMAEAEQWAEMQAMLEKVKIDMDDLRSSRDQWERRALSSELNLRSLHSQIREWKKRAIDSENEAEENRNRIAQASAAAVVSSAPPTLSDQLHSEICKLKQLKLREKQQKSSQAAKKKQVVGCRLIGSKSVDGLPRRRPPLQETGNLPHQGLHCEGVWVTRG